MTDRPWDVRPRGQSPELDLLSGWLAQTTESERLAARFLALADALGAGVAVVARDRLVMANDEASRVLGAPAERLGTTPLWRFVADAIHQAAAREGVARAWRGDTVDLGVVPLAREDGAPVGTGIVLKPLPGEADDSLLIVLDPRRAREAERPRPQTAFRALGLYLAEIAAELREPLTACAAHLDGLTERPDVPAALGEEVRLYRDVTRDTLDRVTRALEWGRRAPHRDDVNLAAVVNAAVVTLEGELFVADIRLGLTLDAVPPVAGVFDQLQLAVEHLLRNACEAFAERGGMIDVMLRVDESGRVALTVQDDGPGIAETVFPRVLEPFATIRGAGGRLAVGLAVVKDVVDRHHGTIAVATSGAGTRITLTFPPR